MASLWKTGKNSAKTGFMTSAQVSLSTDMEYMARSLCDGSCGMKIFMLSYAHPRHIKIMHKYRMTHLVGKNW